jgi:glutaredoxin
VSAANVTMFSRATCGLCDEARGVIEAVRRRAGFEFREVFIEGDPELERRYGERVPVVTVDGREEFEIAVDPDRLGALVGGVR